MVNKKIIIDKKTVMYGTSVKASPESNTSTTDTFDGAIVQGLDKVSWSIELSKVRYEPSTTHRELSETLEEMWSVPKTITVLERVITPTEKYIIRDTFYSCILEGNDYELKPEENTVENLKFKASKRVRKYE